MRPRPAPSAVRTAISRRRAAPRVSVRFATFAQAISSTSTTAAAEHLERTLQVADEIVAHRDDVRAPPFVVLRNLAREPLHDRVEVTLRQRQRLTPGLSRPIAPA